MHYQSDKHQFAVYWPNLSDSLALISIGQEIKIDDPELYHRIIRVLRLARGENIIFFDKNSHAYMQIGDEQKNAFHATVLEQHQNACHKPTITFLLPLLKREALVEAIYGLTETGASEICLMRTTKSHQVWSGDKELDRLRAVSIAAAEQSKNFCFPEIIPPKKLYDLVVQYSNSYIIFFDPEGENLFSCIQDIRIGNYKHFVLIVGSESDLSSDEKNILRENKVNFIRLTPTILRAQQAAVCAMALMRSLIDK